MPRHVSVMSRVNSVW